jgi:uncharacterized protein YbjQ (UPF0145 family)
VDFNLILFLVLLVLGYGTGRYAEHRHYKSILRREDKLRGIPAIASKRASWKDRPPQTLMVTGSVVVSVDYFKRFVAGLRSLVGGRITTYETLLDRARREAILRMKERAEDLGAYIVFNVKIETASISKGRKQTVGSVEVLAYGTALIVPK